MDFYDSYIILIGGYETPTKCITVHYLENEEIKQELEELITKMFEFTDFYID
jgi:hypothetical protein